ncbi:DUF502 domain-containing protein [Govanella unica]|uniref:DUF502 domain-containing protein n=1 Tax=Govanella unica TaxID=2975056 RepID=A0A9X3TX67_9PROT|nr:DUF502 domain-containing protein [Govania unica]MDA5193640.1 DUF502 domain-containing protein [Govania unica]
MKMMKTARKSMMRRLRNYLLTGIVVAAPVGITAYLVWSFITTIDSLVAPLIPKHLMPEAYLPFPLPGFGLVIVVTVLILLGAFAANFFGRALLALGDNLIDRTPIIRSLYATLKQVFQMVVSSDASSFKEVVLIEYPRPNCWSMAFVINENTGEVKDRTAPDVVSVFLPTVPLPTSGLLLFIPRRDLISLNMSVDDGLKFVISGGIVVPPRREPRPENPSNLESLPTDTTTSV